MTAPKKWTPPSRIRAVAIAVILNEGRLLVFEGYDNARQTPYYRPLGGEIEFGESGEEALIRELREEVGQDLRLIRYLATLENRYTLDTLPGHELVRVYTAELVNERAYRQSFVIEEPGQLPQQAYWKPLAELAETPRLLMPHGLWELLDGENLLDERAKS